MDKMRVEAIAKEYTRQLGYCENTVAKVSIQFRKKRTNWGTCRRSIKRIIFKEGLLTKLSDEEWHGLIAHEVAHFRARNHNKRFRLVLAKLNQSALTMFGKSMVCTIEEAIRAGIRITFDEVEK